MQGKRAFIDRFNGSWMIITLLIILLLPLCIGLALYYKSIPILADNSLMQLIIGTEWKPLSGKFGFLPFILSSLYVTLLSFIFSAPVCLFAAIYLTQFASKRLINIMHPVIDILAGLPSVIYGVWGVLIIVPFIGKVLAPCFGISTTGYSILAGGIVLAIMCIPYMLNMLIDIFGAVPCGLKEASLSLGATLLGIGKARGHKKQHPRYCFIVWIGHGQSIWRNHGRINGGGQCAENHQQSLRCGLSASCAYC